MKSVNDERRMTKDERADGSSSLSLQWTRPRTALGGVFYISCDSIYDRLYLSTNGYWRLNCTAGGNKRGFARGSPVCFAKHVILSSTVTEK